LHALLLGLAARHEQPLQNARARVSAQELEIDVLPEQPLETTPEAERLQQDPAVTEGHAARVGSVARSSAPVAATDAELAATDGEAGDASGDTEAAPSTAPSAAAPHLSLSALGVDGTNPFLDRAANPDAVRAAKAARVKRRLDRALAQGIASQDSASGRGAGGPVVRSLEAAVYASTVTLNSKAMFTLVIDSDGKLLSTTLGAADGDRQAWERIAHQTAQALAQRKLAVPKGKSVRLVVAVTSHLEMPSGADPGVEIDAFGIPIHKGGGPRSTKLDLLNPLHPSTPLSLLGDPADIGANARRMVHAHVVSEELL
jgi:hypothetical protein